MRNCCGFSHPARAVPPPPRRFHPVTPDRSCLGQAAAERAAIEERRRQAALDAETARKLDEEERARHEAERARLQADEQVAARLEAAARRERRQEEKEATRALIAAMTAPPPPTSFDADRELALRLEREDREAAAKVKSGEMCAGVG